MKFTIITPSYNQLDFLRRCIASVRDQVSDGVKNYDLSFKQEGKFCADLKPRSAAQIMAREGHNELNEWFNHFIPKTEPQGSSITPNHLKLNTAGERLREPITVHHHVQDGGSTDGTVDWLRQYDAEVRGQRTASGPEGPTPPPEDSNPNAQRLAPNASLPDYTFSYESVPDNGMYDAIKKGFTFALQKQVDECPLSVDKDEKVGADESVVGEEPYQLSINNKQPNPPNNHPASVATDNLRSANSGACHGSLSTINSSNQVVAWLNCDEQYLPGTLEKVGQWFTDHPGLDVCFGDVLVVDGAGQLICGRRMVRPSKYHIITDQLPLYSAAMFIRASALAEHGLFPDPAWKNTGDVELVLRMMNQGVRFGFLNDYASVFTDTGENLALDDLAGVEYDWLRQRAPWWVRRLRGLWVLNHRIRKLIAGCYHLAPVDYSVYVDSLSKRRVFSEAKPESRWLSRL